MAWLLAFALWLPVAQWAAATHALLHLHASVSEDRDLPTQLPAACDLCVVAAALGGAAPLPEPPPSLAPLPPHAPVRVVLAAARPGEPFRSYQSRAPPLLHA